MGLYLLEFGVRFSEVLLELNFLTVPYLRYAAEVALSLGLLFFNLHFIQFCLDASYALDGVAFHRPLGFHRFQGLVVVGEFGIHLFESCFRNAVLFLFKCFPLDFKLDDLPFELVYLRRHRIDFDAQHGCRLVDEIDSLVRQEPVGDVPIRKGHRGDSGIVLNSYAVVNLVFFFDSPEDGNGVLDRRFQDHYRLKPPLQGAVLLDVFPVFIEGRCPDAMKFTPRQGGFQHIGGIH